MANRTRKPQTGGAMWTGRVAGTTTSSYSNQTVYRIPTGKHWECETLAYEVLGTAPIVVRIEDSNIYRVSLDTEVLQSMIEWRDSLDLSNVKLTLWTVDGDVTFTGNITAKGTFIWTTVTADTIEATTGNITTLNATNIEASDVSTATLETSWNASVGWNLTVAWTSTLTWLVTTGSDLSVAWDLSVTWNTTTDWLTATTWTITTLNSTDATITNLDATSWDITTLTSDNATLGQLSVTGASSFTGDITAGNISASWNTSLNNLSTSWNATLANVTVNGASTLTGNTSVWGNLSVSGNETVTGNSTVTGDAIFSSDVSVAEDLTVSGDTTVTDDLIVNGVTHLNVLETTGSAAIGWNLNVDWSIAGWSSLVVENQIESGSVVTTNTVTDNLTVNGNIALWNDATAPDFVLQSEKWQANGVTPLNANGKVDPQYLPPVYTTAIVKMGTGVFSNSNTSTIVDEDITADSFVILSNYSDIVWDLNEVINIWQITVASNEIETWSYKYIIVNPLPSNS